MLNSKSIALGIVSVALCANAFATTIDFPVGQRNGTFNCTLSDPAATVNIDTNKIDINGGCEGQPFVKANGHLEAVPAATIASYYFQVSKKADESGSVELVPSKGNITCNMGHGDKNDSYGNGSYCLK